jgi:hypothetical protein
MRTHVRRFLSLSSVALLAVAAACKDSTDPGPTLVAPTGVAATTASPTSVVVTWNLVPHADGYEVDRAEGTGDFSMVKSGLAATAYTDTGLTAGAQYRYRIRAMSGTATGPFSSEVTVGTQTERPKQRALFGVTQNTTLYADTTYVLSGYVKVSNGATLTIQPGTRIVGDTLTPGSSLWILRGSKIMAQGTKDAPIVFTSQRSAGNRKPGDWGGLIIVGNAPINRTANPIFTEGPTGAAENYAGGTDFNDSSGSLKYVRVEFAGYDVSNGGGQELNSVSSYAVGRGTTYDYVEAIAGLDDGFESFGGGQDMRHIVSFETGDDHFDFTEGFAGRGQFLIALQTTVLQPRPGTGTTSSDPRGFEGDGCEIDKAGCTFANQPYSRPVWANFTVIGPGTGVFTATDGNGAVIRRGASATMVNGIIARWPGVGISIRDAESKALVDADSTTIRNVILADNGSNFEPAGTNFGSVLSDNATAWNIRTTSLSTLFGAVPSKASPASDISGIDLTPSAGSAAVGGGLSSFAGTKIEPRVQNFFGGAMPATSYVGAVDPSGADKWWDGWTAYYTK